MSQKFDRHQLEKLISDLSDELSKSGHSGQLFIVGGAAMSLVYDDSRATRDIDAVFAPAPAIRECAEIIAKRNGYEDDWLNDAAKGFMPGNDPNPKEIFKSSSLQVLVASPEYLFAMKLQASRADRDISDAAVLFNKIGLQTGEQALDLTESFYDQNLLSPKHQYVAEVIADKASDLKNESPENRVSWQETAAKYAGREVDWEQINQYAQEDTSPQPHNYQYDCDYLLPGIERDDGVSR